MASTHRAIHNMAIRHLEASTNCSNPSPWPAKCAKAMSEYSNSDAVTPAILDGVCEKICIGPLNEYFECISGVKRYANYMCVKENNKYCLVIRSDRWNTCFDTYECDGETCPGNCRSCLSRYIDDVSCCYDQYERYGFMNITKRETDECGNTYNTCSGGAI